MYIVCSRHHYTTLGPREEAEVIRFKDIETWCVTKYDNRNEMIDFNISFSFIFLINFLNICRMNALSG